MLTNEQAQARLAEWKLPKGSRRVADGVEQLPEESREHVRSALNYDTTSTGNWQEDWQNRQKRQHAGVLHLEQISAQKRANVFALISPHLVASMERAWQLHKTLPYQAGYVRKAFRTPYHSETGTRRLGHWLESLAAIGNSYTPDVLTPAWLAAWAPHLDNRQHYHAAELGVLLGGVLCERGPQADEVFEILRQSLNNQHEIGEPGKHVFTALLLSDRPEAWELVENTLLAAQRQEGLRQAILETVDLTHPTAFRRMLRLILDQDLIRFSAVVRAFDVWLGQLWVSASAGVIKKMLEQIVTLLDDAAALQEAVRSKDPETVFLALWCMSIDDAIASVPVAEKLLTSKSVEIRYVAARHLANLDLDASAAALIPAIDDEDLRVALLALPQPQYQTSFVEIAGVKSDDRFERIERLVERVPEKPLKLKPLVWPWTETTVKQSSVAACLLNTLGARPATRLIPHLDQLDPHSRTRAVTNMVQTKPWGPALRAAVLDLAGDASSGVRNTALQALESESLAASEIQQLEGYLSRKAGDLRLSILSLILKQSDEGVLESSGRLVASKDANQRLAGLELLRLMTDSDRSAGTCRARASAWRAGRKSISTEEQTQLQEIAAENADEMTLENALGLMNPAERTPVIPPQDRKVPFLTAAAAACLKSLDDLIHEHRETTIQVTNYAGTQDELLGNAQWGFPYPNLRKPRDNQEQRLPLAEVWKSWTAGRDEKLRGADGLELYRAWIWQPYFGGYTLERWNHWAESSSARKQIAAAITGDRLETLRYPSQIGSVLMWLLFLEPCDPREYVLDALETVFSMVPAADHERLKEPLDLVNVFRNFGNTEELDWRDAPPFQMWTEALVTTLRILGLEFSPAQQVRRWQLLHWQDEPVPGARRRRVSNEELLTAYKLKAASLADVADQLLAPRSSRQYYGERFELLSALTARKRPASLEEFLTAHPEVRELVESAVTRILNLELSRGDAPTAGTVPAPAISALRGIETLRRILHALGKADFKPGRYWSVGSQQERREILTQLAKVTFPADGETADDFVRIMRDAVKEGQFPEERLLQLAFLAPQWTKSLEAYTGWDQMSEGVYWFLAHMRYLSCSADNAADGETAPADGEEAATASDGEENADGTGRPERKLSPWERLILERTPLTNTERAEGAIDVPWFVRTHALLGNRRWLELAAAARFAANASQARRAQFIADVLLNKVKRKELIDGITKKQLKEQVRLLGLLPLATGAKRDADLSLRCKTLRDYLRYANQLSGLTKPQALRAWEIGMKNLAMTAGYPDPLRLEWAVGADEVRDLAEGSLSVTKAGVTVTLALDELSKPSVTVFRGEKELKALPAELKKDKQIAELTGRVTELKRQASAIRQSLETAMCRGDSFTGAELQQWCGHALLAPQLSRLIVTGEGIAGYPDKRGKALRNWEGKLEPVKSAETLRFAHPHDLLEQGVWHDWQAECMRAQRMQPFKQVFRELYVITKQEKKDGAVSHRYDGQQVQPKQALALFGQRGWNTTDGIFKIFHAEELTASVWFDGGFGTPLEVEGGALGGVSFTRRDEWKPIPLSAVPPRLFSEVMRDLDLVVSVAHAGGVDPEASASTVEMRSRLLQETCALLKMKNVRCKPSHAVIKGELAEYTVHLGSGTVHKMPGGSLCIVPVHAQHRGRIFLPFADDDPRTAEVISKVLLLARDREIQDPAILEQIRRK